MAARRVRRRRQRAKKVPKGVFTYTGVRTWFKCDVYPERHPADHHEIAEHFYTISVGGNTISEEDVISHHHDKFPHHEVLDYSIGRIWHYYRDKYGSRIRL